ncbi:MAG TPA: AAA family ATPase [Candidatus Glassbacteria bacterium]|nr:AAA family ATPase [Candidatus Glassbacteria bacterium]
MAEATDNTQNENSKMLDGMATKDFTNELTALMKIRAPIVFLTCREEKRMLKYFEYLVVNRSFRASTWDCYSGMLDLLTGEKDKTISDDMLDPDEALHYIIQDAKSDGSKKDAYESQNINGKIYLMLDFYKFLDDPATERRIKTFAQIDSMTMIVITGPSLSIPPGLNNLFSVLDFPYPNKNEIEGTIKALLDVVGKESVPFEKTLAKQFKENKHEIISSVNGLTLTEASKALAKSVVVNRKFDIPAILGEKKQYIRQRGTLEFYEPDLTMNDVGGLATMRSWLERRKLAFDPEARAFGIPALRGVLICGIPGGGKSLTAKAIASYYRIPLLKLDFGTLFRSHVGESEETAREACLTAEALAPSALWIDEIDKGLSGTQSSGSTDGGTTDRVVSTFLTWMEEKKAEVFVVATANEIEKIPAPFFRRFDEIFFVDFPHEEEREEIATVLLRRYARDPKDFDFDCKKIAKVSDGCSGSEIEKAIRIGLFEAFSDKKRELTTKDIERAFKTFTPQYKMRPEYFKSMTEEARQRGFVFANEAPKIKAPKVKSEQDHIGIILD